MAHFVEMVPPGYDAIISTEGTSFSTKPFRYAPTTPFHLKYEEAGVEKDFYPVGAEPAVLVKVQQILQEWVDGTRPPNAENVVQELTRTCFICAEDHAHLKNFVQFVLNVTENP